MTKRKQELKKVEEATAVVDNQTSVKDVLNQKKAVLAVINQKDKLRDYLLQRKGKIDEAMVDIENYIGDEEKSIFEDSINNFPYSLAILKEGAYRGDKAEIMVIKKPNVVHRFSQFLNEALVLEINNVEKELSEITL